MTRVLNAPVLAGPPRVEPAQQHVEPVRRHALVATTTARAGTEQGLQYEDAVFLGCELAFLFEAEEGVGHGDAFVGVAVMRQIGQVQSAQLPQQGIVI